MPARKGQMFVVTAVFLTGLLFAVQQVLLTYSLLDLSRPMESREHYMVKNVLDSVGETITASGDCLEFERNLNWLLMTLEQDYSSEGYVLDTSYYLDCSRWDNEYPAPAPFSMSVTMLGRYDVSGTIKFYKGGIACVPDGCNGNCPGGCTHDSDPDCGTATCGDGCMNGDETGTDCGGSCVAGTETICDDGIDNDNDCLVDCADPDCRGVGPCPNCVTDGQCDGVCPADCTYAEDPDCCTNPGSCPASSVYCMDGCKNGDEEGMDCGGPSCAACITDESVCQNAEGGGLCDGLDITYGIGYGCACCLEFGYCCPC